MFVNIHFSSSNSVLFNLWISNWFCACSSSSDFYFSRVNYVCVRAQQCSTFYDKLILIFIKKIKRPRITYYLFAQLLFRFLLLLLLLLLCVFVCVQVHVFHIIIFFPLHFCIVSLKREQNFLRREFDLFCVCFLSPSWIIPLWICDWLNTAFRWMFLTSKKFHEFLSVRVYWNCKFHKFNHKFHISEFFLGSHLSVSTCYIASFLSLSNWNKLFFTLLWFWVHLKKMHYSSISSKSVIKTINSESGLISYRLMFISLDVCQFRFTIKMQWLQRINHI